MPQAKLRLLTVEDYENMPDDGNRYEIVEGALEVTPPPHYDHQNILVALLVRLRTHVDHAHMGEVVCAPVGVILSPQTVFEPDIVFTRTENLDRIVDGRIKGPPDLVVEVSSPGTARLDRHTKLRLYAQFGIPEYWIVDRKTKSIHVHTLGNRGYEPSHVFGPGSRLTSATFPGFDLVVDEIFPGVIVR